MAMRSLRDAVVVVTGASSGIGKATALELVKDGAAVVLAARQEAALHELARACEQAGGRALVVPTDVTQEESVRTLARRAVETFGHIDVWINNAGVYLVGRTEDCPWDVYRRVLETNLFGTILGARAALPLFREQRRGVLVNVASVSGAVGMPFTSAYVASKFAVRGFSESLREELHGTNIDVVTVIPASIDTPLFQHAANFSGRGVRPVGPVYGADKVARAIVNAARAPRREVTVGAVGTLQRFFHAVAPPIMERVFARQTERDLFQDAAAPPTEGNLFAPRPPFDIVGGWRKARERRVAETRRPATGSAP
jgi:short-subunit dehydrogenase